MQLTKLLDETKHKLINKQQYFWFCLGSILFAISFVISPVDSYYATFFLILRSLILGGTLAVINNRFKFFWFAVSILGLLAAYYLYLPTLHGHTLHTKNAMFFINGLIKWFLDDLVTIKSMLYVTGSFCLAHGLISELKSDQIIFKLAVTLFAIIAIPMLLLFLCALAGFDGLGMGLIFGFLFIPFILFMLVVGGMWILSGEVKNERVLNDGQSKT